MSIIRNLFLLDKNGTNKAEIKTNANSSTNELIVAKEGYQCSDNSSSSLLGSGAVFTGSSWEDTLNYGTLTVGAGSDVASATDGLEIQWSSNGIDIQSTDNFTIDAGTNKVFTFGCAQRYVRVVYTNGASAQTSFYLEINLKPDFIKHSSHRIQDTITDEDDAVLNKSVLSGEDENGIFQNVKTTRDGNLSISDNSDGLAIAEGNVTGKTFVHKFGYAPDFDGGDGEVTVWDGADDGGLNQMVYVWSTTAVIDTVSSSDATDTQTLQLQGLDANYDLVVQNVTLNGQTKVTLTTPLIRIFRGKNDDITALAGNVYVYEDTAITAGVPTDSTKVRLLINNGNGQTLMAVYTIANGVAGYVRDWYASTAGASKDSQYIIRLWARGYSDGDSTHKAWQLKHVQSISDVGSSNIHHNYDEPEKFSEKTDIMMTVEATNGAASQAAVAAGFDIVLVEN